MIRGVLVTNTTTAQDKRIPEPGIMRKLRCAAMLVRACLPYSLARQLARSLTVCLLQGSMFLNLTGQVVANF